MPTLCQTSISTFLAGSNWKARYELDYWGLGNRQALDYILEHDDRPFITVSPDS
jgi:hypothetical protein